MSPTIALKNRLSRALVKSDEPLTFLGGVDRRSVRPASSRSVSIGSEIDLTPVPMPQDPEEKEGVELLLGMASIVTKEIASSSTDEIFEDDNEADIKPRTSGLLSPMRSSTESPSLNEENEDDLFAWTRSRTVSIDSPTGHVSSKTILHGPESLNLPAIVTPLARRTPRKASLKVMAHKASQHVKFPKLPQLQQQHQQQQHQALQTVQEHKRKALKISEKTGTPITTIYRKKFSWKNYPELEAFLVANREEYLRHSALNYTVQQKQYNNRLTERLLDLAAEHGYVFDVDEFSFVTVRDRIRCYYKSYVQSSKKRGIVLGYAARKAGILTTAELQKSARKEGTIITPPDL
mmetsp:Transcript_29098/g.54683  ORF Transcript_29098/g.54683 Transcript_29098/m.54683 type:complete len:349 (-) Transcript_29098:655-1701(-)